jgi:hypothetical protein
MLLTGCSLGIRDATYPVIKHVEGLSVLETGGKIESCILKQYGFSKVYKLEKKDFSLHIILSNRHFPQLYLGAKDKDGNLLEIRAVKIHPIPINHTAPFDDKTKEQYGMSKIYSFMMAFEIGKGSTAVNSSGTLKLYLYDTKGKKIGDVELDFDMESNTCVSLNFI